MPDEVRWFYSKTDWADRKISMAVLHYVRIDGFQTSSPDYYLDRFFCANFILFLFLCLNFSVFGSVGGLRWLPVNFQAQVHI